MTKIKVLKNVLEKNENQASINRDLFRRKGILVINIMGTPGAGKTTFIKTMANDLRKKGVKVGVIEGDYEGSVDAEKLYELGIPVVQLNVNSCHLNANFIKEGIDNLPINELDVIFIENVGNLICPAGFDLGEGLRITLYSIPEGDDKPIKYPVMFNRTDVVIFTKTDLLDFFEFNIKEVIRVLKQLNPNIKIFAFSSKKPTDKDLINFIHKELIKVRSV